MRKLLYIIISTLLLTACELETPSNGAFDGNWQLRQVDTLATGGRCDMTYSYVYWAVESHVLLVRDIDNENLKLIFHFDKSSDRIWIYNPNFVVTKDELIPLESDSLLTPLGILGTRDTFDIEKLSHSDLVVRNRAYKLYFRKY
ncbi:MAG: lipocalin-like domain-containing protein [Bacteroidaceae bacterium]|nr:lipocalin-like domain-containing protein [Bacteroidaceae bacterium]